MRRRRVGRCCATLLLLWFAVLTGAPSALHACPVHGPAFATAADAQHSAHSHQAPDRGDHQSCTCVGDCAANGVAPGLPSRGATFVLAVTSAHSAPIPPPDSPAVTAPAFLLPYANGPPGARRVA